MASTSKNDIYKEFIVKCYSDEDQQKFLDSEINTIIKAGPGSGKTQVLTLKAAKLLFETIREPRGLACITYTKKATQELKNRLKLYGIGYRKNLFVDTIHKFCINNIIYPFANIYGKEFLQNYKIVQNSTKKMSEFYKRNNITENTQNWNIFFKEYKYSDYSSDQEKADNLYNKYKCFFYDNNLINFDLIIDEAVELLDNKYICKCLESKFPYLLIDEYQDSSIAMHTLFQKLMDSTNIIFYIVGDPNQAIYGFTASSPEYYNELYKSDKFQKIEFKKNYRTQNNIFSIVKNFIGNNNEIPAINKDTSCYYKQCDTLEKQIEYIVTNIIPALNKRGILNRDICILYRDYRTEAIISDVLTKNDISFVDNNKTYVHKDFNDSDLVIWFEDLAFWLIRRNKIDKDIQFKTIFNDYIKILYSKTILSFDFKKNLKILLYKTLSEFIIKDETKVSDFIKHLNEFIKLEELIKLNNMDEINAYESFCNITEKFSFKQFIEAIESENSIRILSSHSSKGLEYSAVIIPDLEDGRYPAWSAKSEEELNEEKRLLFVATTRAKKYLFILASGFYIYKNTYYRNGISRFFKDIQPMFIDCDKFN